MLIENFRLGAIEGWSAGPGELLAQHRPARPWSPQACSRAANACFPFLLCATVMSYFRAESPLNRKASRMLDEE